MDRRHFLAATAGLLLTGCARENQRLSVGTKNFTEQLILGEILAQLLESQTHSQVERRFYLAGSYICHQALLAGRIDLYIEYTGTALAAIVKEKPIPPDQVFAEVQKEYKRRFNLEVFPSLGFNNTFALAMRGDDARAKGITRLSQLAMFAPSMRIGVGYEFLERADGFPGLAQTYGLRFAAQPSVMDLGLIYRALQARQVDIVAGSNTDGLIAALGLQVLEDDRHYFPPYDAVPIVRPQAIAANPEIRTALNHLSGRISSDQMRRMNYAVDGEKRDAQDVAREFLRSIG